MNKYLTPGLVSVTLRQCTKAQIIDLMLQSGLRSVEWGGDIHIPHGDLSAAKEAAGLCRENGIEISAYGSYYRLATSADFSPVLDCALAMGAPMIRIWAGEKGSRPAGPEYLQKVRDHACALCDTVKPHGIKLSLEYHGGTLTDTLESTLALLQSTPDTLLSHWQPPVGSQKEENLQALSALQKINRLGNLHCFAWEAADEKVIHHSLAYGTDDWQAYLSAINTPCHVSLEFVKENSGQQLLADARTLHEILNMI